MQRRLAVIGSAVALASVLVACSSSSDEPVTPGSTSASTTPSVQPPSTTFTSRISPLVGLRLTWPNADWRPMDGSSEVVVESADLPDASLHITKGLFPTAPDGRFLTTRKDPGEVADDLHGLTALRSTPPTREHLGAGLAVARLDFRLSPSGPSGGLPYLAYRGNNVNALTFTIEKGMSVRLYTGVFSAPYGKELLNVVVEAPTGKAFSQWSALAERALQSLRLPKGVVPTSAYGEWGE